MIILEETDPGTFDRGAPTLKMVHQLSSTRDPVFSMGLAGLTGGRLCWPAASKPTHQRIPSIED